MQLEHGLKVDAFSWTPHKRGLLQPGKALRCEAAPLCIPCSTSIDGGDSVIMVISLPSSSSPNSA